MTTGRIHPTHLRSRSFWLRASHSGGLLAGFVGRVNSTTAATARSLVRGLRGVLRRGVIPGKGLHEDPVPGLGCSPTLQAARRTWESAGRRVTGVERNPGNSRAAAGAEVDYRAEACEQVRRNQGRCRHGATPRRVLGFLSLSLPHLDALTACCDGLCSTCGSTRAATVAPWSSALALRLIGAPLPPASVPHVLQRRASPALQQHFSGVSAGWLARN